MPFFKVIWCDSTRGMNSRLGSRRSNHCAIAFGVVKVLIPEIHNSIEHQMSTEIFATDFSSRLVFKHQCHMYQISFPLLLLLNKRIVFTNYAHDAACRQFCFCMQFNHLICYCYCI